MPKPGIQATRCDRHHALWAPFGAPRGSPTGAVNAGGVLPLRVPEPGLSRRHRHITRPHSANTRVPTPPPAPRARCADPGLTRERRTERGPVADAVPGASRAGLPGRSALLAASSSLSSARPRPPGGSGSLRSSRPGGTGVHAAGFGFGAPSSPAARRRLGAPGLGVRGAGTRGSSGCSGCPALPPARSPSPGGGASLAARGRHGLDARRDGGGVGPGAAGGGAAADAGTDAGAAARPLAMAPPRAGGSHLPSALPSPPDARRALPFHRPARPPACAATCGPPSRMLAWRSAPGAPGAAPLCSAVAALGPPYAFTRAAGLWKVPSGIPGWGKPITPLPVRSFTSSASRRPSRVSPRGAWDSHVHCLRLKQWKSRRCVPAGWAVS